MAYFDRQPAIVHKPGGRISVYYGGIGPGHGHVRATGGQLGESIVYWRLPESEGDKGIVDNAWGTMNGNDLRDHLAGF